MGLSAVSSAECSRHLRCAAHVPEEVAVRKSVPGDRRVRAVEITPKGLELFDAAHVARGATG